MWEWLKTVSLLKSDLMKDVINPRKLIITKKNWINVKNTIFLFKISEFFKFLIEKKMINTEKKSPKPNEYEPIKLAKFISPLMQP